MAAASTQRDTSTHARAGGRRPGPPPGRDPRHVHRRPAQRARPAAVGAHRPRRAHERLVLLLPGRQVDRGRPRVLDPGPPHGVLPGGVARLPRRPLPVHGTVVRRRRGAEPGPLGGDRRPRVRARPPPRRPRRRPACRHPGGGRADDDHLRHARPVRGALHPAAADRLPAADQRRETPSLRRAAIAGVLLGAAILVRSTAELLPLLLPLWLLLRRPRRESWRAALVLAVSLRAWCSCPGQCATRP